MSQDTKYVLDPAFAQKSCRSVNEDGIYSTGTCIVHCCEALTFPRGTIFLFQKYTQANTEK